MREQGKDLVRAVLQEAVDEQVRANLGGIIGGKEAEEFAKQDLLRYAKALYWFDKNVMSKTRKS